MTGAGITRRWGRLARTGNLRCALTRSGNLFLKALDELAETRRQRANRWCGVSAFDYMGPLEAGRRVVATDEKPQHSTQDPWPELRKKSRRLRR